MIKLTESLINKQIKEEHEQIKRGLTFIREEINIDLKDDNFHDWRLEFIWQLRDFRNHLFKHFDFEEDGGFMHDILEQAPEKIKSIKKLEEQHHQIAELLDRVLSEIKAMQRFNPDKFSSVKAEIFRLLDQICGHENEENELIQSVYYQEYGYPAS